MSLTIYVEGGGNTRFTDAECRRGFRVLFEKLLGGGPRPTIVACGSRNDAYERFRRALEERGPGEVLLLVDSEGPIAPEASAWAHLQALDRWTPPPGATDEQVHLMVQCMEAWFLADREALARFYGQGFNANALPGQLDVERIPKAQVLGALKESTRRTKTKGPYDKGSHGFELLRELDPERVRQGSARAGRLFAALGGGGVGRGGGGGPTARKAPGGPARRRPARIGVSNGSAAR